MQLANREIPNGWCYAMHGMIVGVEKISEQHVSGYGFTEGHGRLYGFYSGPHYGHWGTGSLYGSSELFGEQRVWTDYEYATRFFIQDSGGRELPVNVFGDHLPIRDGHRVIAIVVRNSSNSDLLFAMINETTSQELSCCRNGELLRHLDIPAYRYVRALGGRGSAAHWPEAFRDASRWSRLSRHACLFSVHSLQWLGSTLAYRWCWLAGLCYFLQA